MKKALAVSALLHRGHRVVRGGYHPHASVFFRVGRPAFAFGVYAPAPFVMAPGYCHPVWVPGHSIRDRGARVWIAGYWSR